MFQLFTGSYRAIESALLADLQASKKANGPWAPLLVLSPSPRVLDRIQNQLAGRGAFLNIHFLTFHALAERLLASTHRVLPSATDPLLLEEMIANWFPPEVNVPRGQPQALASTLKDLYDAEVDADAALDACTEGHLGEDAIPDVFRLYQAYSRILSDRKARTSSDLLRWAAEDAAQSPFLQPFKHFYFYGFYDLTGLQLRLMETLTRLRPSSVYFPYRAGEPACHFAGILLDDSRFRSQAESPVAIPEPARIPPQVSFFNASGTGDEVWKAAKEILRLHDGGVPFADMAVVAREIDTVYPQIARVLADHAIPFATSAERPFAQTPAGHSVQAFLRVLRDDIPHHALFDFLRSPFSAWANKDILVGLQHAASRLDIHQGYLVWKNRLASALAAPDDERPMPPETADLLNWVADLHTACETLAAKNSWASMAGAFADLVRRTWIDGEARESVLAEVNTLAAFDQLAKPPALARFWEVLERRFERRAETPGSRHVPGVQVMDAMTARGLEFRALILLGMNERFFPRQIREDPFLRDSTRGRIASVLGNKLYGKLLGYEEEKLLFHLLTEGARERIILSWQRSDDEGVDMVPSLFIREYWRAHGGDPLSYGLPDNAVPVERRPTQKIQNIPEELLTPKEVSLLSHLRDRLPSRYYAALDWGTETLEAALASQKALEARGGALTPYDGLLGEHPEDWAKTLDAGLSPTALQRLAACPFQSFARSHLHLKPVEEPAEPGAVERRELGTILHEALRVLYESGRPLEDVLPAVYRRYDAVPPGGYPLLWDIWKEHLRAVIERFARWDRAHRNGWTPALFERETRAPGFDLSPALAAIPLHGQIDRLDVQESEGGWLFRVIDYKAKRKLTKNLVTDTLKGTELQPLLYAPIGRALLEEEIRQGRRASRPIRWAESVFMNLLEWDEESEEPAQVKLTADFLTEHGAQAARLLEHLVEQERQGRYFIRRGAQCRTCDYTRLCRKEHMPTRWRVEASPEFARTERALAGPPAKTPKRAVKGKA